MHALPAYTVQLRRKQRKNVVGDNVAAMWPPRECNVFLMQSIKALEHYEALYFKLAGHLEGNTLQVLQLPKFENGGHDDIHL